MYPIVDQNDLAPCSKGKQGANFYTLVEMACVISSAVRLKQKYTGITIFIY
jgi:hypothetical protein